MQGGARPVCPVVPWHYWYSFTPKCDEACMEFTSCTRMLHSQQNGHTEIWTHNFCIQSPMHYPFGHHISMWLFNCSNNTSSLATSSLKKDNFRTLVLKATCLINLCKTEYKSCGCIDDDSDGWDGLPRGILLSSTSWLILDSTCFNSSNWHFLIFPNQAQLQ